MRYRLADVYAMCGRPHRERLGLPSRQKPDRQQGRTQYSWRGLWSRPNVLAMTPKDVPKLLGTSSALEERLAQISQPHVNALTQYVRRLRDSMPGAVIPNFDPWDGGVEADVLYLLEAPGPKARDSGFISRNNPDETAKNFFLLNSEAGIPRKRTVTWNAVPFYIGSQVKIRAALRSDILEARESLVALLALLPQLRIVVLFGRKAQTLQSWFQAERPELMVFSAPHPSPLFVNRAPANRMKILEVLRAVGSALDPAAPAD
jgi:uracil-DNA glycosylase